jgi:hypothetical protein
MHVAYISRHPCIVPAVSIPVVAQAFFDFLLHVIPETCRGLQAKDLWEHLPEYMS